jgi:hypothetical protein
MDTHLFQIDPQAGIAYGMYNALKKSEGSFEDFLLHYDSHAVNEENDNSWLTKLVGENMSSALSSPEVMEAMGFLGMSDLDFLASSDYFDTQVTSYKLQLTQEMNKRNIKIPYEALIPTNTFLG